MYPFVCLDGIDAVGKTSVSERLKHAHNWPVIRGSYRWDGMPWPKEVKEITDGFLMTTVHQLVSHVHAPIVFDRSTVSSAAYQCWKLEQVPWDEMYPVRSTLFVTILGHPRETLAREGLEVTDELVNQRLLEQNRFRRVSSYLGTQGYRTMVLDPADVATLTRQVAHATVQFMAEIDCMELVRRV